VQGNPDSTTRSAPESPIIGLTEDSAAAKTCQEAGASGTSKDSTPELTKPSPSVTTGETATPATSTGDGEAERPRNLAVRVVPFQSLPQSAQAELGKEHFDDPLLTVDNVKKLADYMQWSFKFTKVRFPLYCLY